MEADPVTVATEVQLASETDLSGFRSEAARLLARQQPPGEVQWQVDREGTDRYVTADTLEARARATPRAAAAIVPPSFQRLCELVVQHRDPDRFALLYRLLWRLVHEPQLRADPADPDLNRAQHMGHAVRRDIHKAKTLLRMRPLADKPGGPPVLQLAWYEPTHHIIETVALWNAKRMGSTPWALLSPERSAWWNGKRLLFGPGLPARRAPHAEAADEDWLKAWRSLFPKG